MTDKFMIKFSKFTQRRRALELFGHSDAHVSQMCATGLSHREERFRFPNKPEQTPLMNFF